MKNSLKLVSILIVLIAILLIIILIFNFQDESKIIKKSEYTKCIEKSKDRSCEITYLRKLGYNDGIDCINDYNNPICDFDRYNTEVKASRICFGQKPNLFDCAEMIKYSNTIK